MSQEIFGETLEDNLQAGYEPAPGYPWVDQGGAASAGDEPALANPPPKRQRKRQRRFAGVAKSSMASESRSAKVQMLFQLLALRRRP